MIPDQALSRSSAVVLVHNRLKRLLPKTVNVYQRLSPEGLPQGSLFWIQQQQQSLFLFVSDANQAAISSQQWLDLFADTSEADNIDNSDLQKLLHFQQRLLPKPLQAHKAILIPLLIAFTNVREAEVKAHLNEQGVHLLGKESLSPSVLETRINQHMGSNHSGFVLDYIRSQFSPETVVSVQHSIRQSIKQHDRPDLSHFLLDYDQERALKLDLNLPDTTEQATQDLSLRLINGVAGSGKSLILLRRIALFHQLYPEQSALVLIHNKAITHDLQQRYQQLKPDDKQTQWFRFMQWCRKQLKGYFKFAYDDEVMPVIQQTLRQSSIQTSMTAEQLWREINFYKDRLIFSESDYLKADRAGQGFALNEQRRRQTWALMQQFEQHMRLQRKHIWADLPRMVWQQCQSGELQLKQHHAIFIDEAQFFAPIWFELVKQALAPNGQLFMVADPAQGFLNRRISWSSAGLNVRGRTTRLAQSYRTSKAILAAAQHFRQTRLPDDQEDWVEPNYQLLPKGKPPKVWCYEAEQDEHQALQTSIQQLLDGGVPASHILILVCGHRDAAWLGQLLKKQLDHNVALLHQNQVANDAIKLCTLNAATGLESPIVFITGLHHLFNQENNLKLEAGDLQTLHLENTRKIYMGMTRAGEQLFMLMTGDDVPEALHFLRETTTVKANAYSASPSHEVMA